MLPFAVSTCVESVRMRVEVCVVSWGTVGVVVDCAWAAAGTAMTAAAAMILKNMIASSLLCGSSIRQLRAEVRARRTHCGQVQSGDRTSEKRKEMHQKKCCRSQCVRP